MARNVAHVCFLPAAQPFWLNRWYFLMVDGTMWSFSARDGATWQQAPSIPGSRVVTCISAEYNFTPSTSDTPTPTDTVYAACTDGTIWRAVVTSPFTWSQVASLPA